MKTSGKKSSTAVLRQKAEEQLKKKKIKTDKNISEADMVKLVHELKVHQIELEMQNEELLDANKRAKDAAEKYTELFDFAPAGYFILSAKGVVKELNHVGANMLGMARSPAAGCLFVSFVSKKTRPLFKLFFENIFISHEKESCNVIISANGNEEKIFQLSGISHESEKECFVTAIDITEQKNTEEALRESEKRFSLFMDYLPAIVFMKDSEGRTIYTNKYMNDTVGSSQWVGKTMLEIFPNEFGKKLFDDDMRTLNKGYEKIEENIPTIRDGALLSYETQKFIIERPGKKPFVGGISLDVTTRKHAEETMRESELRFREVLENSIDAPYKRNIKTNEYEYLSPVFFHITGYTPDEMKSLPLEIVLDLMHPDDVDGVKRIIAESMVCHPGSIHNMEYRFKHKDGRYRWIQDKYIVKSDRQGNPESYIGSVSDITEHRRMEDALHENEKKWKLIFEKAPFSCTLSKLPDGVMIEVNETFEKVFGYPRQEAIGKTSLELGINPDANERKRVINEIQTHSNVRDVKLNLRTKSGEARVFLVNFEQIDFGGEKYSLQMAHDITKRDSLELKLKESEEKHRRLFDTMSQGVIYFTAKGEILSANTAAERILKLPFDYMKGKNIVNPDWKMVKEDGTPLTNEEHPMMIALKTGKRIDNFVMGIQNPQNQEFLWLSVSQIPIIHPGEETPYQIYSTFEDITIRKKIEVTLKESEQNYKMLADSGHTLVWASGTDKLCNYFNKIWLEFTGRTLEQELGNGWVEGVHPDDLQHCLDIYLGAFDRRDNFSMEYRLRRHDGEYCWIQDDGSVRYNSKGEFIGYIGHCYDINEHRRAIEALRESEERLTLALEQSHLAYWEMDVATGNFTFNDRFYELYHTTAEREGGYQMAPVVYAREFLLQDEQSIVHDAVSQLLSGEISQLQHEHLIRRRDGEIRNILVRINVVYDSAGHIVGTRGTNQDITELKKIEKALKLSESKLQAILDNSYDGIGVHINGIWQTCNPAALRLFGYASPEELIGTPILNVIVPNEHERITEYVRNRVAGIEAPTAYITRGLRKDGTEFDLEVMLSKFKLEGQWNALVMLRDITERRQAEETLRRSKLRYKTLFEKASDGIMYMTSEGKITGVNESYAKMHGYSVNELIEKNILELNTPSSSLLVNERMAQITNGGKIQFESEHYRKDGRTFHQEVSGSYITIGDEKYIQSFHRDITDRKRVETALQNSEQQLVMAQQIGKTGSWVYDLATDKIWGSAEGLRIFGYPPVAGDFPIEDIESRIPERERVHQTLVDLISKGSIYDLEYTVNPADGSLPRIVHSVAMVEKDLQGAHKKVFGFIQDITALKRAEDAMKQIGMQLTRVMESTKDIIAMMDTAYRYTLFNSAFHEEFKKIFGQDLKLGDSMLQALAYLPDDLANAKKQWNRAFAGEDFIVTQEFGNAKLGRNWYELHFSPIRDNGGNVVGAVHIVRNVSERKQLEEA